MTKFFETQSGKFAKICIEYQGRLKPIVEFLKVGGDPMVAAGVLENILKEKQKDYENVIGSKGFNICHN